MSQLGQSKRSQRRLSRSLDNNRAARSQRRANLAGNHGSGEVPRRNQAAHANGLPLGDDAAVGSTGLDDVAVDPGRLLGEPLEEVGGVGGLSSGIGQGLAVLQGDDLGDVLGVFDHEVVPAAEKTRSLLRGNLAECLEGIVGSIDGNLSVFSVKFRALGNLLSSSRVYISSVRIFYMYIDEHGVFSLTVNSEPFSRLGFDPFAVDVRFRLQQRCVLEERCSSSRHFVLLYIQTCRKFSSSRCVEETSSKIILCINVRYT